MQKRRYNSSMLKKAMKKLSDGVCEQCPGALFYFDTKYVFTTRIIQMSVLRMPEQFSAYTIYEVENMIKNIYPQCEVYVSKRDGEDDFRVELVFDINDFKIV